MSRVQGVFEARRGARLRVPGPAARTVSIDPEFVSGGAYKATIVRDRMDTDAAVEIESLAARRGQPIRIAMRSAGGFVVRFSKPGP
jgi:hypothetical protein